MKSYTTSLLATALKAALALIVILVVLALSFPEQKPMFATAIAIILMAYVFYYIRLSIWPPAHPLAMYASNAMPRDRDVWRKPQRDDRFARLEGGVTIGYIVRTVEYVSEEFFIANVYRIGSTDGAKQYWPHAYLELTKDAVFISANELSADGFFVKNTRDPVFKAYSKLLHSIAEGTINKWDTVMDATNCYNAAGSTYGIDSPVYHDLTNVTNALIESKHTELEYILIDNSEEDDESEGDSDD